MLEQFLNYIDKNNLVNTTDKILLAVSGGIDSVVMLNLFSKTDIPFATAHCNFQLRGSESDDDEVFVNKQAAKYNCPFYLERFNTKAYAKNNKLSIQEAARELRYNWFKSLLDKEQFNSVAIAHNLNDLTETFFINLLRGCGLHGLCSFQSRNNYLIRPLLFATRNEISDYAAKEQINYREDSSNKQTEYTRNAIRHNVIPELEKINSSAVKNIGSTIQILQSVSRYLQISLDQLRQQLLVKHQLYWEIDIEKLKRKNISPEILYELLIDFNFNFDTILSITKSLDNPKSGSVYYSDTHQLLINRQCLQITEINQRDNSEYKIPKNIKRVESPVNMNFREFKLTDNYKIPKSSNVASFDASKISFPLILRRWRDGDSFVPFGMKGHKKISDFFTDQKLSLFDKQHIWLLESGNEIIWVVGYRISNNLRITSNTKRVLEIELCNI